MSTELSITLDPGYKDLLSELKNKVHTAQLRAARAVNQELIKLYWEIGCEIIEKQKTSQWGDKLLNQLSKDLTASLNGVNGFSTTNLKRMRMFAECYPLSQAIGAQAVHQLPWGHVIVLIEKIKDSNKRDWYATKAVENGWSRNILSLQIKQGLYERQATTTKLSNFQERLPAPQSDLAIEMLKDPYCFDFLTVADKAKEQEIEKGLLLHVRDFLLEIGKGFAFVGNQYHLDVGGDDFYIDLLLFNINLNAYTVIELKTGKFKPEYAGKLNFYLAAMDDLVKLSHHNPTIGILLCEEKNKIVAEYALKNTQSPMGISDYQLSRQLPKELQAGLPAIEELERSLTTTEEELEIA